MAFIADNFSPVGGSHGSDKSTAETGVALFSYISEDALSVVKTTGYFNALRDRLDVGDIIYTNSTALTEPSDETEYTIIFVNAAPDSPSIVNVTIKGKDIEAV